MGKKRVLMVSHRWPPRYGGLQNASFMYAENLAKNNKYDVSVFTSKEEGYENICPNGVNLIEGKSYPFLYNNFGIPQPIFTLNALKLLKEAVKNNDFIIINDRYYISSFFAYKYAKKFGKKIILILQTPVLKYKWPLSIIYNINNKLSKNIVKNSDKIFAVTYETGSQVLDSLDIEKEVDVLYNPVDLRNFKKKPKKFKDFTILFVARFVEKKGVFLLPKLVKSLGNEKVKIIAIGDGPELNKIKKECEDLKKISFIGKITDKKKLAEYYLKSHIFLITSTHGEAFPLVIGEALAAGLPIVSTKGGTYLEIFNNDIGYLCETFSPEEITFNLIKLMNNSKDYAKKSKNAYNFAKNSLDIEILGDKIERYIEDE